jgi:hypothetical protein
LFAIVRDEERFKKVLKSVRDALMPKKLSNSLGDLFDFGLLMGQLT